jgi:hypothetical protein
MREGGPEEMHEPRAGALRQSARRGQSRAAATGRAEPRRRRRGCGWPRRRQYTVGDKLVSAYRAMCSASGATSKRTLMSAASSSSRLAQTHCWALTAAAPDVGGKALWTARASAASARRLTIAVEVEPPRRRPGLERMYVWWTGTAADGERVRRKRLQRGSRRVRYRLG